MQMPSNLLQISPWRAYKGQVDDFTGGHRIIIVCPYEDKQYFYLTVTSKVDKAKIRCKNDLSSLIELDVTEWDALTCHSCVECGKRNLKIVNEAQLKSLYAAEKLQPLSIIPEIVKTKIIAGICSSVTYTDTEKAMYTKY